MTTSSDEELAGLRRAAEAVGQTNLYSRDVHDHYQRLYDAEELIDAYPALLDDLAAAQTQLAAVRRLCTNRSTIRAEAVTVILDADPAALAEGPAPETTP